MEIQVYRLIAKIVPFKVKANSKHFLSTFNFQRNPEEIVGFFLLASILSSLVIAFWIAFIFNTSFLICWALSLTSIFLFTYVTIAILIDSKAKKIEKSLPNALQLTASNLRAGITMDKALLLSSRPEFGPLKDELDLIGKKINLGESLPSALQQAAAKIRSKKLTRAVELINSGLRSGGELATLLEATAADLREQFLVDKKIKASISMYIIFIFSAAGIISPLLFGLSSFLVDVIQKTFAQLEIPVTATTLPLVFSQVHLSTQYLQNFLIMFIVANSFMASSLLGLIEKGKAREGFRYFIPMVLLGIPLFFLSRYFIRTLLSGLFNF